VRMRCDGVRESAQVLKDDLRRRAMLIVDGFGNLGIKPGHLFKHRADQRLPGREIKEYRRHRHLGFARDFSVTSGADAAAGEDVNRTSKEQGAPLGFIQRRSAATRRAMTTISHAQMSDTLLIILSIAADIFINGIP